MGLAGGRDRRTGEGRALHIVLDGIKIPVYPAGALVVGAGAAGLNCADELAKRGVEVVLAAMDFQGGTSLNAGSDKQTYHKLSLSGDSVARLARDLFAGGHMHGDTAFALAAGSPGAFYKLVGLGVPFPQDSWGQFVGYRTDHDERARATSAGPLTSRFMAQRLREAVEARGVRQVRGMLLRILTSGGRACGALLYNPDAGRRESPLTAVVCGSVVLCGGGSADLYADSVFPQGQVGAMGAALAAGAGATNLWSWQYGIASTGVRWNLSGAYQQVLPQYVDENGNPFLDPWLEGNPDDAVFLKGYQWPFDSRKTGGSSRIDLAVHDLASRGGRAFLDFHTKDAYGRLTALGAEAGDYLRASGATQRSPYERLAHMNPDAVELYRSKGIDLAAENLPVAVCAQHQNGGVSVDKWWRTTLPGLYAAGEAAGCFGAYRPGGSALNETQVGSLRAAQHIAARGAAMPADIPAEAARQIEEEIRFLQGASREGDDAAMMHEHLRRQFSVCAGPVRRAAEMKVLAQWVEERLKSPHSGDPAEVARLRDALTCAAATLSSMLAQAASMPCQAGHVVAERPIGPSSLPAPADDRFAGSVIETRMIGRLARSEMRAVRPLPAPGDAWFENAWRDFREGRIYDI